MSVPCRLHFLLARRAHAGVIFRRGPSKWTQLIRWDTEADSFEPGQWFHGHLYERRADLSPDGSLLIYFVSKFNRRTLADAEYTYAWTAISRPPYFTALALWPKGDCWHGGGLFRDDRTVLLNHKPERAKPHRLHRPKGVRVLPNPEAQGEDEPLFSERLTRDGWVREQEWARGERGRVVPEVRRRRSPDGECSLLFKRWGWEKEGFFAVGARSRKEVPLEGVAWADWDRRGRLVAARAGRLFHLAMDENGELEARQLADFRAARPEQIVSPPSARRW